MPSLKNETDRTALLKRLDRVTPESKALWGRFDAARMMCHLGDALDEGLGRRTIPRLGPGLGPALLRHFPVKQLAIYVVPMPKSAKAPRELLAEKPGDFETNRRRVAQGIEEMAAMPRGKAPDHFLLGRMSDAHWNALAWKHIDHHLRQFSQ